VASRANGDASIAIKEEVSVDVFDPNAFAASGDQFKIGSRIGWCYELLVFSDDLAGDWPRQFCFDLRFLG
jgi:hypothetical protein